MLRTKASFVAVATVIFLAGCAGLGSMEKAIETLNLNVNPGTLILRGDIVEVEITGNFPAKYFAKKVRLEATPVLVWEGGEAAFATEGFQGEEAAGNYTVVPFEAGKSFTYTASIPFDAAMEDACHLELRLRGLKGDKIVDFEPYIICKGVITTPLLVQPDDKFAMTPDRFQRTMSYTLGNDLNYDYNSSKVTRTELREEGWGAMKELFALASSADSVNLSGATIEAYASPEGEITLNEDLATDRAESAQKALMSELKSKKVETAEDFYTLMAKGEDWDGFKRLMSASNIADKDLILRVLEMYSDKTKREQEIRNIAKTYSEIEDQILPSLRRTSIAMNYTVEGYTDEELTALAMTSPSTLTVEELLFSATLFPDVSDKLAVYTSCSGAYSNDHRGYNNAGVCLMEMGRRNQAEEAFNAARSLSPNNAAVLNNVGAIARQKGMTEEAASLFAKAGSGAEVSYNKGLVAITQGEYGSAISNMSGSASANLALAKLLNGDTNGAKTTLMNAGDNSAISSYLLAICCARLDDAAGVKANVNAALTKDGTLKGKAQTDLEFANFSAELGL
ncbi:MAG: tetratricopeptide repeat protein [Flavobacteriales bacterium]